ncbi:MAG TPA: beta-ketoacyl-ACP synthase 3 [Mycobacteriales bacterium]|nr:beta-ketoacyl-ACP synthase 3 [Mycobacteriales bacterium]
MITAVGSPTQARISGCGQCRPRRSVRNDELPAELAVDDSWVVARTGIRARRLADETETVVSMAAEAAGKAVADAGIDAADVDRVLLATCSMPTPIPGGAAQVAHRIGATSAGAFDVNAACAGFSYALAAAADAVRTGATRHVVVVGAEKLSDWVDWTDRRSAVLFGDGAGAVVVSASSRPGIGPLVCGSDGSLAPLIAVPPGGKLTLDGPAVFRWATTVMADAALRICLASGLTPDRLDAVVPHQANQRIVAAVARGLGTEGAVVADDITTAGNTSAASIPLALCRLRDSGAVCGGALALLLGFGAGLTWAGQIVEIP